MEQQRLQTLGGSHTLLIAANGVLLRISNIERFSRRKRISIPDGDVEGHELSQTGRKLRFVYLPFNFHHLDDPGVFRTFRRMLWLASVHFNKNFDTGDWTPDANGLYNRSDADVSDLTELTRLHNMIFDAIKRFRKGEIASGGALTRRAFFSLDQIVQTKHHRQLPDTLGIMRVLHRDGPRALLWGFQTIQGQLCNQLHKLAEKLLESGDPRKGFFEILKELSEDGHGDPQGHMVMAFDAYCRDLWMARVSTGDMKAYYSYNQSSFPRADRGRFYEKFEGKHREEILAVLREVDEDLGRYSIATFCLWHTALNYLFEEGRFSDTESVSLELSRRVTEVKEDLYRGGQLNFDVAKTYFLLGRAQEEQGKLREALTNLELSLALRRLAVPVGVWDALANATLQTLIPVGKALGEDNRVAGWEQQRYAISSGLEQIDRETREGNTTAN